jgi:serine O-acetyltransferase
MTPTRRHDELGAGALMLADLQHMVEGRHGSGARWWAEVLVRIAVVPRVRAVCLFRLSQAAARRGARVTALLLQSRTLRASGAEISPSARIGPGLCLMHSVGIVIGPDVRIGRGARIYQGVTLGDGQRVGQPVIGDHVTIGVGACVLGGVTVGDRVMIGAGARITRDLPDDAVALASSSPVPRKPGVDPRLDELASRAVPSEPATR